MGLVREVLSGGARYFMCEECGLVYEEAGLAKSCEEFCRKYGACSLEIAKHAVNLRGKRSP